MNKSNTVEAIILSRRDFGEADRLITAFSLEKGKIKILAKGSRKIKSKMASHIEPFNIGKYQIVKGKTFYILCGAEKISTASVTGKDLEKFKDISYLCEILDLTIQEEEPVVDVYKNLKEILGLFNHLNCSKKEIALRFFEFRLLNALGYNPNYIKCINCDDLIAENSNFFGTFEGIYCCKCSGKGKAIDKNTLKILRLFKASNLEEIININGIEKYNDKLKEVIIPYFYDILPRKPKSNEL